MDRVTSPTGYSISSKQQADDILAVEAELLRSEGVDPSWPGFSEDRPSGESDPDSPDGR
ncbi:MAG TPA: hypothetical protein VGM91_05075 [Conexibacter sp.]|jgi:hypothetical protein